MNTTTPQRHGCLTAFLITMLIVNSLTMAVYLVAGGRLMDAFPSAPNWICYALVAGSALNVFLTISLFRWKKWAFYAFCVVAGVMFVVNISIGVSLFGSVVGLIGPAALYGVLQIGKENKGWPQLK